MVVVVSVGINAMLLRFLDTRQPGISTPPPAFLKRLLMGPLSTVLFLRQYTEKVGSMCSLTLNTISFTNLYYCRIKAD